MTGSHPISIAVIDDDESVCRSLSRFLRAARFRPVTYQSAEAFLADGTHPKFDCLLLDIQLGGMSGIELRRKLSALDDATPVIFITAQDDPVARAEAEASSCAGFIGKTQTGSDILVAIRHAVGLDETAIRVETDLQERFTRPGKTNP